MSISNIVQQKSNFNASSLVLNQTPDDANTLMIIVEKPGATADGGVANPGVFSASDDQGGTVVWTKVGHFYPCDPAGTGWREVWVLAGPFYTHPSGFQVIYSPGGRSAVPLDARLLEVAP